MYCDKENINILTALLVKHGVRHVVVCPGSRNAPLAHNFNECPELTCHSMTDERSAAFFALGIRQQTLTPVAICVTSGSALLNTLPGVAEATYQQQGIIVILTAQVYQDTTLGGDGGFKTQRLEVVAQPKSGAVGITGRGVDT